MTKRLKTNEKQSLVLAINELYDITTDWQWPRDKIVGDWQAVKYKNGRYEATRTVALANVQVNMQAGSIWYSSQSYNFPTPPPDMLGAIVSPVLQTRAGAGWVGMIVGSDNLKFWIINTAAATIPSISILYTAIGRWG